MKHHWGCHRYPYLKTIRNAPTVINAAYNTSQFWDGREPDLESQSKQPPVNPVEGGLKNHEPIIEVIRGDRDYTAMFKKVFDVTADDITMDHVSMAIASFERTIISGDSPFDKYMYGGDDNALNASQKRGLAVYLGKGRCVSCHVIEETQALFTDNRFHNIGVGFKKIQGKERDATGWQFINMHTGNVDLNYVLPENKNRVVAFDAGLGKPVDRDYQDQDKRMRWLHCRHTFTTNVAVNHYSRVITNNFLLGVMCKRSLRAPFLLCIVIPCCVLVIAARTGIWQ